MKSYARLLSLCFSLAFPLVAHAQWSRASSNPSEKVVNPGTIAFQTVSFLGSTNLSQTGGYDVTDTYRSTVKRTESSQRFFGAGSFLGVQAQARLENGKSEQQKFGTWNDATLEQNTISGKEVLLGTTFGEAGWGVSILESTGSTEFGKSTFGSYNQLTQEVKLGRVNGGQSGFVWGAMINWVQLLENYHVDIEWVESLASAGFLSESGILFDAAYLRSPLRYKTGNLALGSQVHEAQTKLSWAAEIPFQGFVLRYKTGSTKVTGYEGNSNQTTTETTKSLSYTLLGNYLVSFEQYQHQTNWAGLTDSMTGTRLSVAYIFGASQGVSLTAPPAAPGF